MPKPQLTRQYSTDNRSVVVNLMDFVCYFGTQVRRRQQRHVLLRRSATVSAATVCTVVCTPYIAQKETLLATLALCTLLSSRFPC